MARNLRTMNQIHNFINQVSVQATHHAPNVVSVIQSLSAEVINRLTLGIDKIEVYERNGKLARTCWVTINGIRKVFTYNYSTQQIDLKDHSLQGNTIFSFDNTTTIAQIKRTIRNW